jgi:hypothetical protein
MNVRIEMLPPDVPPELLHVIAAAAAPQHLQACVSSQHVCTTLAVCTWGTSQIYAEHKARLRRVLLFVGSARPPCRSLRGALHP